VTLGARAAGPGRFALPKQPRWLLTTRCSFDIHQNVIFQFFPMAPLFPRSLERRVKQLEIRGKIRKDIKRSIVPNSDRLHTSGSGRLARSGQDATIRHTMSQVRTLARQRGRLVGLKFLSPEDVGTLKVPRNRTKASTVEHFGESIRLPKYGYRLNREQYALVNKRPSIPVSKESLPELWASIDPWFEDEQHTSYTDEHCAHLRANALENFDLNMAYYSLISEESFEKAVTAMLRKNKTLRAVTELSALEGQGGLYVMVLDQYRQVYIGQAANLRQRIKRHWSGTKQFDRLVFGMVDESVMSIDAFQALDTTRLFAATTTRADALEARVVKSFPANYRLNRIGGGKLTQMRAAVIETEMNRRQLQSPNSES
jgi:hypothetical protein